MSSSSALRLGPIRNPETRLPEWVEPILAEHIAVVDALRNSDSKKVVTAMHKYIISAKRRALGM